MTDVKQLLSLTIPTFEESSDHPVKKLDPVKLDVAKWLATENNKLQCVSLLEQVHKQPCLGLAANQCKSIGIIDQLPHSGYLDIDAFVLNYGDEPVLIIAPEIVEDLGIQVNTQEGCLTYPRKYIKSTRSTRLRVNHRLMSGELVTRIVEGLEAQVFQHEIDHLLGNDDEVLDYPISSHERGPVDKLSRNDECGCGSTKKFKKCCGALIKEMMV